MDFLPDWAKSAGKWVVRKACQGARGGAKAVGLCLKTGGKIVSTPMRGLGYVFEGTCTAAGLKRIGRTGRHLCNVIADVEEMPTRLGDQFVRQSVNTATLFISDIVGDGYDVREAEREMSACYDEVAEHFRGAFDELIGARDEFTGRVLYDAARQEYAEIRAEKRCLQKRLDEHRECLRIRINKELKDINVCRRLAGIYFRNFEQISAAIANWKVQRYEHTEVFISVPFRLSPMTSESKIFKDVNFTNSPIQNYLKGFLTAGLMVDSQVKDARVHLDGVRRGIKEEAKKAKGEIMRWTHVCESLEEIRKDFEAFNRFFRDLIQELDYSLQMLRMNYYQRDFDYFGSFESRLNVFFLPDRHLKCLMACDKMARILCTMAKQKYLDRTAAVDVNQNEVDMVRDYKSEVGKFKRLLAA